MRKLLIIMTVVFGLCFSILGNALSLKLNIEDSKKILLKGEVLASGINPKTMYMQTLVKYKSKLYRCKVGGFTGWSEDYLCYVD